MRKGQISFDLMLTIAAIVLFLGSMTAISNNMSENSKETSIKDQERKIAYGLSEVLTASSVLSDGDFRISYDIPSLYVIGKNDPQSCLITTSSGKMTVSYTDPAIPKIYEVSIDFVEPDPAKVNYLTAVPKLQCGLPVVIKNA